MPELVFTGLVMFARPVAAQGELKLIVAGCVYNAPSVCCRTAVTDVLPPAERLALWSESTPA